MGRRRARVPRPVRRDRGELAGARAPGARRRGHPAGQRARAHVQSLPARTRDCFGRTDIGAPWHRCGPRRRAGFFRQLRRGGQRGGDQAGPPVPGPAGPGPAASRHGGHRERVPRAHHGSARADRQGVHPRAVRPVRHRRAVRALRGRGRPARRGRPGLRGRVRRAVPGRSGCHPAAARLPPRGPGGVRRVRRAAGHRRDPERHRAHRALVRAPGRRRDPRRPDAGQGAGRGAADRGVRRIR